MTLVLAILAAIPAVYGLVVVFRQVFSKTAAQKAEEAIVEVENALEKAKRTGDTSDVEKILN